MQSAPQRVLSVDVLRGLTIALMILVNDPGDWSHTYSQLDHAPWNGFTLTDLVFPNFLFLVGASIIFSLASRVARGESKRTLALHIFRRAATIFAIKMFLTAFPHFHMTHLRIFGVLTRIAICYLVVGLICLATQRARTLIGIAAALLVGYWVLMRFVPVPGFGTPTHDMPILDPDRNLAAWLDRAFNAFTQRTIHTGVLYNHTRDPEGLLSTLPAIATTLIGSITGLWLRRTATNVGAHFNAVSSPWVGSAAIASLATPNALHSEHREETPHILRVAANIPPTQIFRVLLLGGLIGLMFGLLWSFWFPINKNLWTSSYVLFSAGWSLLLLAICYWLIDMERFNEKPARKSLLWPWLVFGSNAITAFVVSNFLVECLLWLKVPAGILFNPADPSKPITAWLWAYRHIFARYHSTQITSLAFAVTFTAICFIPNWILWQKKLFLKV